MSVVLVLWTLHTLGCLLYVLHCSCYILALYVHTFLVLSYRYSMCDLLCYAFLRRFDMLLHLKEDKLDKSHAHKLSQLILVDTPQTLHTAALIFHYNHSQMVRTSIIRTNLTCLRIMVYDASNAISIYSFIPVLRVHNALRSLSVTIRSSQKSGDIVTK